MLVIGINCAIALALRTSPRDSQARRVVNALVRHLSLALGLIGTPRLVTRSGTMRPARSGLLWTVVLLCMFEHVPAAHSGTAPAAWTLSAVVMDAKNEAVNDQAVLWVGAQNQSDGPRLFCVEALSWGIQDEDSPVGRSEGSSHACRALGSFRIVRAHETTYLVIPLPTNYPKRGTAVIEIDADVVDAAFGIRSYSAPFTLSWKGSLDDARRAARELAPSH